MIPIMVSHLHTQILSPSEFNLQLCAEALKSGQLVAMPTETVYGLAGLAFNETAITEIFLAKERPRFDPLIVHVSPMLKSPSNLDFSSGVVRWLDDLDLIETQQLSKNAQITLQLLAKNFWPGPLTLILPKSSKVPDLVTSGLQYVGIRMPSHRLAQKLIEATASPLAAPSANRFGRISPTTANDVFSELSGRIPFILDGGRSDI